MQTTGVTKRLSGTPHNPTVYTPDWRSANRRQLVVPRHRRSKFGRRLFSVAAPTVLEFISRLSSGPNAERRQLQIGIKDSPVRGATGHVAH